MLADAVTKFIFVIINRNLFTSFLSPPSTKNSSLHTGFKYSHFAQGFAESGIGQWATKKIKDKYIIYLLFSFSPLCGSWVSYKYFTFFAIGSEDSDTFVSSETSHSSTSSSGSTYAENLTVILGAIPSNERAFGPEISEQIAKRWKNYVLQGLDKDTKIQLLDKWCVPANCTNLQAPQLNPEVQAMVSVTEQKKETFLMETSRSGQGSISSCYHLGQTHHR